jgi:hypothetical protein
MSLSDDSKLLIAVFQQIDPFPKLDYERLKSDLGLPSVGAAQVRWSRYTTKLKKLKEENEKTGALKITPGGAKVKKEGKGQGTEKAKKRERGDEEGVDGEQKKMKMEKVGLGDGGFEHAGKTGGGRKKTSVAGSLNATTSKPGGQGKGSKAGRVDMMEALDQGELDWYDAMEERERQCD